MALAATDICGRELPASPQVTLQVTPQVTPQVAGEVTDQVTDPVTDQVTPQLTVLKAIFGEMSRQQIQESLGLKHVRHFRKTYLEPTLRAGLIEMTVPDKPQSSQQRYRLTPAGRRYLRRIGTQATVRQ